ncbi:MAG: MgtC/SapB family protein [Oscillospiraceae bacterium]|nr:MgtC/SapB family protein [Oscillospiraceae bacterium]
MFSIFWEDFWRSSGLPWEDVLLRVFLAALIGFLLGLEREISHHPAGMKTHMLVCLGSALASLIACEMSIYAFQNLPQTRLDVSRIASGVVSGMGFIGAGAIMKSRDGTMVTGITTAATLWVTACLGLAIGMGEFRISIVTFVVVLFSTLFLKRAEKRFFVQKRERSIDIMLLDKQETLPFLDSYFESKKVRVISFEYKRNPDHRTTSGDPIYTCRYTIRVPHGMVFVAMMRDLAMVENILEVYETLHGKEAALDYRKSEEEKGNELS